MMISLTSAQALPANGTDARSAMLNVEWSAMPMWNYSMKNEFIPHTSLHIPCLHHSKCRKNHNK